MLTKEEFYEDIRNVCSRIRERCETIYAPLLKKGNGRRYTDAFGNYLNFTWPDDIGEIYALYLDGYTLEDIHKSIHSVADVFLKSHEAAMEMINTPFGEIEDRIICLVVSNDEHSVMQGIQVFDDYTYFKAVYYVEMYQEKEDEPSSIAPILLEHLERWGKDRDDIFDAAMKNQEKLGILFTTMDDACDISLQDLQNYNYYDGKKALTELDLEKTFLLTSSNFHYAVSLILNDRVLSHIYKIFKGNYYVLPGTVHEVLIIPDREGLSPEDIKDYQSRLCHDEDDEEDVLDEMITDEVFYYEGEEGQLVRVNKNDAKAARKGHGSRREIITQSYERASA